MRNSGFFLKEFSPATTHMAFLSAPVEVVAQHFLSWMEKLNAEFELPHRVYMEKVAGTLQDKLVALLPLANGKNNKTLLFPTKSRWSVYVTNGSQGGDVHSPVSYMAELLGILSLSIVVATDVPGKQSGSTQFVFRDMTGEIKKTRLVSAHRESHWEWSEYGDALAFEEAEKYSARKIKDRLTPEMVERYCGHLGISLFDPEFYEGDGYLVHTYAPPNVKWIQEFPSRFSPL